LVSESSEFLGGDRILHKARLGSLVKSLSFVLIPAAVTSGRWRLGGGGTARVQIGGWQVVTEEHFFSGKIPPPTLIRVPVAVTAVLEAAWRW
jgi:hypothetical protein